MSPTSGGTQSSIQTLSHPSKFPIKSPRSYRPNEFAGSVTPKMLSKQMSIHSPVARTMANHRRALSVRSKTSNNTNKNKRRMNRAKSVEIDSSRLGLNNDDFSIHVNNESHHENNDFGDSKEGTPMRSFSRTDENRRSKKSNKSEKSTKSTKASLTLPLDMNKV